MLHQPIVNEIELVIINSKEQRNHSQSRKQPFNSLRFLQNEIDFISNLTASGMTVEKLNSSLFIPTNFVSENINKVVAMQGGVGHGTVIVRD